MTMAICPHETLDQMERAYIGALEKAKSYDILGDQVVLHTEDGDIQYAADRQQLHHQRHDADADDGRWFANLWRRRGHTIGRAVNFARHGDWRSKENPVAISTARGRRRRTILLRWPSRVEGIDHGQAIDPGKVVHIVGGQGKTMHQRGGRHQRIAQ